MNASAAIAAIDVAGLDVNEDSIRKGLEDLSLPGRFQVIGNVVLDVGHNPQAARMLAKNLENRPCSGKTIAIFGMLADKDIEGVIGELKGQMDEWFIFPLDVPRGADIERLKHALEREKVEGCRVFRTVSEAWDHACATSGENDRIVIFGSFYTVADFMKLFPPGQRG
ncbi:MAG TPA: cyanophycin synthetase [Burkholderiales bacterium]|nr:cyanophycin synthetase [Burkholderiales bacterium]